jgi:hypothetical protein
VLVVVGSLAGTVCTGMLLAGCTVVGKYPWMWGILWLALRLNLIEGALVPKLLQ